MNCVENIIGTKAEMKRYINTVKSKKVTKTEGKEQLNRKFYNSSVTPSMIINLFTNKNDMSKDDRRKILTEGKKNEESIFSIIQNGKTITPSYWKKIRGLADIKVSDMTVFQKAESGENITGLSTIQRGIAYHHLVGSIKTEFDLMDKYNLTDAERNLIMPEGEVVPGISAIGTAAAIGKDILASQNIILQPKRKQSKKARKNAQFEVEKVYTDVGMRAIRMLQADGFLNIESPGGKTSPMIINADYRKSNGSKMRGGKLISGTVIRFKMDKMLNQENTNKTLTDMDKKLLRNFFRKKTGSYENNLIDGKWQTLIANTKGTTYLNRLIVPSNSIAPETEYKKNDHKKHDVHVSKDTRGVLDRKEQGELFIPEELETMFDYIFDKMEKDEMSFEQAARSLGVNDYKDMMGYIDEKDSTAATSASNMGKSLSKTTPLSEFFDNYAEFRKLPLHLREEVKRNGRGHYMTTLLNPQTDKHFSRYVMQIKPYKIEAYDSEGKITDTFDHLLAGIADQAGIPLDEILGNAKKPNEKLESLLASYHATDKKSGPGMFLFMAQGFKKYNAGLSGSVWQQADSLKAIYDVRRMLADNESSNGAVFNGTFMPKPDGTASGAVIMAMQMAGKNADNASLFEYLGLHSDKTNFNDAYGVVTTAFNEKNKLEGQANLMTDMTETLNWLGDKKNGIFKSLRDLAKFSSMTVMYNQGEESSVNNVADDLFDPTYRKLEELRGKPSAIPIAEKILSWIEKSNPTLHEELKGKTGQDLVNSMLSNEMSESVYESGIEFMRNNVTNIIYQITQNDFVNKYLSEHQDTTAEIFEDMNRLFEAKEQRITLISPESYFAKIREVNGGSFDINNFRDLTDAERQQIRTNDKGKVVENGIPLMKLFQMVQHPDKNSTLSRWEFPHAINANVNIVHALDFAILNEAFRRTYEEMDNPALKNELQALKDQNVGTVSIHDAIAAHPSFSAAYQNHYREAARDINAVYDIHSAMTYELTQMQGYEENKNDKLIAKVEKSREAKIDALKDMKYGSKKVFGFEPTNIDKVKFGKPLVTVKQQKQAETDNKTFEANQDTHRGLTKYVSIAEGKQSHSDVSEIMTSGKPYVIYDTETTGMNNDYTQVLGKPGSVVGSMPYQVSGKIVNPDGTTEQFDVYFKTKKLSPGVVEFLKKLSEETGTTVNLASINKKADKDGRTNEEKLAYLESILGGKPMIAYNAQFDSDSMTELLGDTFNKSKISTAPNDALGAIAYQHYLNDGSTQTDGMPLTGAYTSMTGKPPLDAHNAMGDVNMTEEILTVVKPAPKTSFPAPKKRKANMDRTDDITEIAKASKNPIIQDFLTREGDNNISWGDTSEYQTSNHAITISNDARDSTKALERTILHEIFHYDTVGYMYRNQNDKDIKKVQMVINYLNKNRTAMKAVLKDDRSLKMFNYVTKQGNDFRNQAEFIAVLGSEPEVMADFEQAMKSNNLLKFIGGLIDKIRNFSKANKEISPFSSNEVLAAIGNIQEKGVVFNINKEEASKARAELAADEDVGDSSYQAPANASDIGTEKKKLNKALEYNKQANPNYVADDPLANWIAQSNAFVGDILWTRLGTNAEGLAKKGAKEVDKYLTANSKVYRDYRQTTLDIWDNERMAGIKAWLVPSMIKGRDTLHKMSRVFQDANQKHGKATSTEVTKMDNKMAGMTNSEQAKLNDMFSLAPSFMLTRYDGIIYSLAEGITSINKEIARIEAKANDTDIKDAKDFANLYVDGVATGRHYNLHQKGTTEARVSDLEQLTGLYSLQKIPGAEKMLRDVYNDRNELFIDLVEKSIALERTTQDTYNDNGDKKRFRGNMTLDYYDEPFETQVVPKADIANGKFNINDGWEVIIPANDNHGHAVVIKKGGQSEFQESFGTNVDYGSTDVYMPDTYKPTGVPTGLVEFGEGKDKRYKVVIPTKIKKRLGLIQNPAHTLVRSYAHMEKIRDTAAIRDEILSKSGLRLKIYSNDPRDTKEIEKLATERGENEPWFLDMGPEVDYTKLPDAVKKRFSPIKTHMSGVGSFSSKVRLVRNDIAPWMTGYERAQLFKGVPGLEQASKILVQAIALMKIHMIIVNPAKVTLDMISTTTLLMSNGVSPVTIAKGWTRNIKLMSEMSDLKAQEVDLTIRSKGGNKSAERMLSKVQDKIKNHPLAGAMNAGVMQSLTTDIITRDYDTITGLQRNIEKFFNKLTHTSDGEKNNMHKAIMWYAKRGINVDNMMANIAEMGKDSEAFKGITKEIGIMGERISKIKADDDVAKYLGEYFASPSSTLTRLGSMATTYPDAMSRIIYRDHLIAKSGKTEAQMSDAEISAINLKVSDMMPDYSFAPPMELDGLGRYFITPFVSYSARIQRVILNLANKNPLTFFGGLLLADMMGIEPGHTPYHVVGSNYLTREEFINNVFTDLFDLQTPLPVNALNFDIKAF